jgi:multidrug efflux pump subunit AcrA (membrane-fusion protein)
VTIGQAARVRLASEPNVVRTAQVVRVDPTVDAADRGFGVWLRVADLPTRTLHGTSARVDIVRGERRPGLAVPLSAVARDGSLAFVFVRRADGRFDRRHVTLGAADDQFAEVIAGVSEGETVAVGGVDALQTLYAALR